MKDRMADLNRGILQRFVQVMVILLIQAAVLFLSSWKPDWWAAWLYVGLYLVGICVGAPLMLRANPETIAERGRARGMKDWDKVVGGLSALMHMVGVLLVAGLDVRFAWTGRVELAIHIIGIAAFALGSVLFYWAMLTNAYFSTGVRIQEERGHTVCTAGPYRFVRHPGYVAAMTQALALPLFLGSLWAFIPAGLAVLLLILRTALEDRTLREELPGYEDYARGVRYRLLPGVW